MLSYNCKHYTTSLSILRKRRERFKKLSDDISLSLSLCIYGQIDRQIEDRQILVNLSRLNPVETIRRSLCALLWRMCKKQYAVVQLISLFKCLTDSTRVTSATGRGVSAILKVWGMSETVRGVLFTRAENFFCFLLQGMHTKIPFFIHFQNWTGYKNE